MKLTTATMLSLLVTGSQALASAGAAEVEGMGLLSTFFISFALLILLFQFLPGMALFAGMIRGIFSREAGKGETEAMAAAKGDL